MSHHKPRAADPVRAIPSIAAASRRELDNDDKTSVDVRRAPIPFTTPISRGASPAPRARVPRGSNPPPNVIPFTKPRAIAALAASHPGSVAMQPAGVSQPPHASTPAPVLPAPLSAANAGSFGAAARPYRPQVGPASAGPSSPAASSGAHAAAVAYQPAPSWPAAPAHVRPAPAPVVPAHAVPAPVIPAPPIPAHAAPAPAASPPIATNANAPAIDWAPPPAAATVATPGDRWAVFDKLGLGRPKEWTWRRLKNVKGIDAQQASKWLVSAYRLLGFSILTIIVIVLIGYITTTAFFYVSDSWVVPMAITPSDEKVLSLQAQVSTQQDLRDRIADELNQAERAIVAQQTFQAEFEKAIRGDLASRRATLERWRSLASTAAGTRAAIRNQNRAYAGAARKRMQQEYRAGLIDRNAMLSGKFQLAQISSSNLSLAERQAEYETRAAELEATARSLDAILTNQPDDTNEVALSYDVLQIKQQYETSRLELAKAVENRNSLKASLERQNQLLTSLHGSAYLRAIADEATVAFVPYGNLTNVKKGEPLYKCKLTMVICFHVGEVIDVIPGEVQFRHPHRDKNLRGQLVELRLDDDDQDAGMEEHLFVGGKPFLL